MPLVAIKVYIKVYLRGATTGVSLDHTFPPQIHRRIDTDIRTPKNLYEPRSPEFIKLNKYRRFGKRGVELSSAAVTDDAGLETYGSRAPATTAVVSRPPQLPVESTKDWGSSGHTHTRRPPPPLRNCWTEPTTSLVLTP